MATSQGHLEDSFRMMYKEQLVLGATLLLRKKTMRAAISLFQGVGLLMLQLNPKAVHSPLLLQDLTLPTASIQSLALLPYSNNHRNIKKDPPNSVVIKMHLIIRA